MNENTTSALVGLAIVLGIRVLDWVLPKGWHNRWADRYGRRDKDDETK
ncbi:MAG: hypothetical protein R2686_07065 [Candidatus Nanopelagicales bacterium]